MIREPETETEVLKVVADVKVLAPVKTWVAERRAGVGVLAREA